LEALNHLKNNNNKKSNRFNSNDSDDYDTGDNMGQPQCVHQ
jgi:hypothetical protein